MPGAGEEAQGAPLLAAAGKVKWRQFLIQWNIYLPKGTQVKVHSSLIYFSENLETTWMSISWQVKQQTGMSIKWNIAQQ